MFEFPDRPSSGIIPVAPPVDPTNLTIDPVTVEQVKAQLAKATTVTAVKNALAPLLDALS